MLSFRNIFFIAALPVALLSQGALAQQVTVSGQLTTYPVLVKAHNTGCNGHPPVYFGYSVDSQTKFTPGYSVEDINHVDPTISVGNHIMRFKSWTNWGECPELDLPVTIRTGTSAPLPPAPAPAPTPSPVPTGGSGPIPANAVAVDLNPLGNWQWNHDPGTPGTSVGTTNDGIGSPSLSGSSREFKASYSDRGGEIFYISFASDTAATHFVYDTYVYVTDPSQLGNLELDMNQVTANGQTMVLGTQCSSYSKTWEYTTNYNGGFHWNSSNIPCNPLTWTANTWHHVQIASHRDNQGNATYDWVNLDGTLSYFVGATGFDSKALGWAVGHLVVNVQLDGASPNSGSIDLFLDNLKVYRW
jgi:hypothetical protein